jgi:hypothetical protein
VKDALAMMRTLAASVVAKVKQRGFADVCRRVVAKRSWLLPSTWALLARAVGLSRHEYADLAQPDYTRICHDIQVRGVPVVPFSVDVAAFRNWLSHGYLPDWYMASQTTVATEKALEHYLSEHFLALGPGDTFLDIAASSSPWAPLTLYSLPRWALQVKP